MSESSLLIILGQLKNYLMFQDFNLSYIYNFMDFKNLYYILNVKMKDIKKLYQKNLLSIISCKFHQICYDKYIRLMHLYILLFINIY